MVVPVNGRHKYAVSRFERFSAASELGQIPAFDAFVVRARDDVATCRPNAQPARQVNIIQRHENARGLYKIGRSGALAYQMGEIARLAPSCRAPSNF